MKTIKEQLSKAGVSPKKSRGQNFLFQQNYCEQLLKSAEISSNDYVLEIGPGLGALTKLIYEKTNNLTCIEIESKFIEHIKEEVSPELRCINSDFRKVDLAPLSLESQEKLKIISNLPYVFSTDAILWLIKYIKFFKFATLLVQKDFAQRIVSEPNSKVYGSISVHAQFYFDMKLGIEVPGSAFHPKTEVTSQQLIIFPKLKPYNLKSPEDFFEKVVRASFSMRRKTITNCLSSKLGLDRELIEDALSSIDLNPRLRAENLSIQNFCELTDRIYKNFI